VRELEPPDPGEGFDAVERVAFARTPSAERTADGLIVAIDALSDGPDDLRRDVARAAERMSILAIGWRPAKIPDLPGVEVAVCLHDAGPPRCWCRPPLPGLAVAWAHRRGVDLGRCRVLGESAAMRILARTLAAASV
jgi:hypothetical protein